MARQRKQLLPVIAALAATLAPLPSRSGAPDILLPEPFAVELPAAKAALAGDDEALRALLTSVQAAGDRVSVSLPRERIGPGAWPVILSAWSAGVRDRPVARRAANLVVLPHGMTAVGLTGYGGASNIARAADGSVHMVWTDGWRGGGRDGAMYRRASVSPDGTVRFESEILDLAQYRGDTSAMPTLTAVGNTVHFAWQAEGTLRYRSLTKIASDWRWSDEIDTKVPSVFSASPVIAADANTVHVLTGGGDYLASRDGGATWTREMVPFGDGSRLGTVSLTLDHTGRPLAAASLSPGDAPGGAPGAVGGNDGAVHCTLRLAQRIGAGAWQVLPGPLDGRAEWEPADRRDDEVTCDALRILEDPGGAMHAVWQGVPRGRREFGVQAYYAWRQSGGDWSPPVLLPRPDPVHGLGKSFVTGLILDRDVAMPLVSLDLHSGWRYRGADAALELFRNGERRAAALAVTGFIRDAMTANEREAGLSTAFPGATPALFHAADGRVWADVLTTLNPLSVAAPGMIVWLRPDVTEWLRAAGE